MKQKIKNTVKRFMILPAIMLGLLCLSTIASAQKATPPVKDLSDIMLGKRAALEVIERALGEWGSQMVSTDPSTTEYVASSSKYAILYVTSNVVRDNEKLNVSSAIEEAGKLVWAEKLITDETAFNLAVAEVKKLLHKNNNLRYKENY